MKINPLIMTGLISFALITSQVTKGAQPTTTNTPAVNTVVATPNPSQLTDEQVKQIQKVVHDYLVKNPQVLVEASQAYQDQELAKAKSKTQQAISKNTKSLFNAPLSPAVGNRNGDVTVIEFLDYQCTHCREMSSVVGGLIKDDHKLRVVIKELPIFGGSSKFAAQASIAAMKQGQEKFLGFHKSLLEAEPPLTDQKIIEVAKNAGLNTAQLETDMKSKAVDDQINDNFKLAQALGLLGTPAFIVSNRNGTHVEYVPGAVTVDNLKQAIAQVRK